MAVIAFYIQLCQSLKFTSLEVKNEPMRRKQEARKEKRGGTRVCLLLVYQACIGDIPRLWEGYYF